MIKVDQKIRTRFEQLLKELCAGLYEREEAVRLALLSAIAGESIFLLGPPGVGKSLIARRLKYAFRDGTSFEYLMSKFSTPDEIFGPISIKKLKEEDKYERLTDRYLPGANIVFLDEIWKAGPAIQNALLTILNEKIYRNGDQEMRVNVRGIITASNELPPKNHSLDPIWDRFLIRLEMGNIRQFRNFLTMITETEDVYEDPIPDVLKISEQELDEWSERIDRVEVPAEVLNTIQVVKIELDNHNQRSNVTEPVHIYDRRWKKIVRLLRTSAFLNGRDKVDLMDCSLMAHCLWSNPLHREIIREVVGEALRKHGYSMAVNLQMLKRETEDFESDVNEEIQVKHIVTSTQLMPVQDEYYELIKDASKFEGNHLLIRQFRQLELEETQVVNFYDQHFNLVNRLKAQKGREEHSIEVFFNDVRHSFRLRTQQSEKTQIIYKKPHRLVEKYWEERYQQLQDYIAKQEEKVRRQAPGELNHLEENLFADPEWLPAIMSNMEEVKQVLGQLKLRLEKIQYAYAGLE